MNPTEVYLQTSGEQQLHQILHNSAF